MNLYRLDYRPAAGGCYPVCDILGPRLIRARRTADRIGRELSIKDGLNIELTRINGAGTLTTMGTFRADSGRFVRRTA